jgi:C4-dicarboxylate transporter DctM subunit
MKDRRYPPAFATAVIAAAGATATLVPPSIDLIIIGIVANISIAGLFAAGFLPGVVNAIGIMALVYWYARKLDLPLDPPLPWREKLRALRDSALAVLMAVIILGGILGGVFTPTEASAVAVVYGFLVSVFLYRELKLRDMPRILLQTCELTGVVMLMIGMASVLSFILTLERIPHAIASAIAQNAAGWVQFVLLVNVVFLILGMFMDALPALIILMPILVPAAVSLGMDPIHFGILVEANVGLSLITPPVGVVLYVACGLSRLPIEVVVRPLVPFIAVLVGTLLIISYVPDITLFVPRLLGHVR